jgi:hypothetical protein
MDLSREIMTALDAAAGYFSEHRVGDLTTWTEVVHRRVGELAARYARAHGFACGVATSPSPGARRIAVHISGGREPAIERAFLFDQCWLLCNDGGDEQTDGYTINLVLAMESEFNTNPEEVYKDFLKLVVTKADTKLLVASGWDKNIRSSAITVCERTIKNFARRREGNDNYILSLAGAANSPLYKFHHYVLKGDVFELVRHP